MCKIYKKDMVIIIMVVFALILGFSFETEKVEAATTYGANLVVNGNAEANGTVTNYPELTNYAGWTSVSEEKGGKTAFLVLSNIIVSDRLVSPNGGNFFDFYPSSEESDTLYQMIDISDIFTDVDSGYIVCDLRGYLKKLKAASSATIVLEMLDSSDQVLSSYQLTEDSADDSDDWVYKYMINIPVNTNTRKFRISLNASISDISPDSDYIEFDGIELYLKQVPAMNVKGNNNIIANEDYIPDISDHTNFGSADITSGSVTRTFIIENNGTAALSLYGVPKVLIAGANASDFTVTTEPSSPVSVGGTTAFEITFNPSAVGVRSAKIVIENNSFQEPYEFYIEGTGTETPIAAANVQITAPVLGATPQSAQAVQTATNSADFTVTNLAWNEPLTTAGKFKAGQVYTVTVTLTSKNGKKFQSNTFTPTVAGSASVGTTTTSGEEVGNTVSFTVTYAATGELTVSSIAVTTQPTKMSYIETTDGLLALNGMQITETNNDGTTRIVSFIDGTAAGYTSTPANGAVLTNTIHNNHPVTITHTVSGKIANTNNLTVGAYVPSVPVTNYDVWVGGIRVTSANMGDVLGAADEGATVTYTPATGSTPQTLSMSGATITGAYTEEHVSYGTQNYTIYAKGALNIVLTGDNTVTGEGPIDSYGIYTIGALTISGTGSLTTSGASGVDIDISYGIRSYGNITITSGTVTASGGDAEYQSRGIGGNGVTISGGTVSATAGNSIISFGLDGFNIIISGGTVTVSGIDNAVRETDGFVYSNGIVSASTRSDGYNAGPYNSANKDSYRYLYYEPASPLTGTVTISGIPKYGQTLTATYNPGNNTGTLSYQWNIGDIIRGKNPTYTLVEEDIDKTITCQVSSTHHTGSVTSNQWVTIAKADGPEVTGVSAVGCTTIGNNDGKLIGVTIDMEYKSSSAEGYTPGTGSDITGLTYGYYYVRVKETTTHKAGNYSIFSVEQYDPPITVPGAPTIGTATAGNGQATVSFAPPVSDGGAGITSYTVTANPGAFTGTGTDSPITVTGLTNGTEYIFTVTATNSKGTSAASVASNSVTPSVPVIDYDVWVGGIRVTSANRSNISGEGITGTIIYDPDTHTLTLYGTTINAAYTNMGNSYGIYTDGLLNLVLVGINNVNVNSSSRKNYGVYANGALNVSGNGGLNVTALHGVQENIAIYTNSNLNISGGTITARSGDILGDGASYGIYAGISLTVSGGTITVSCGNATVYYAIVTPTSPTFFGYTPLIMAGDSEENASRVTTPIESYGFIESYIRIEPSYTITYIITYRPGANGSGSVSTDSKIHATDIGLRGVTFTRTGYTQTGWATSDGGAKSYELEAIYSVDEAVDLYPVWTIIDLPDPDIATVDAAKIAAYNASYLNMTQASTVSGAAINVTLKATAEAAVNNSSVTTTINGISYTEPVVGTSANPNGTNGTYTFTVTVTKGVQSQTTEQKSITIISTPFIGATDTEAVEAAKVVIVNGTVNVAYGANQNTKTAAVQTYMNNLINSTATATGVTGIVTYSSGNTYSVTISKGSASDTKTISMTVNEAANPSPTPTPTPVPDPDPTPVPDPDPTPVPDPDPTPSTVERTEGTVEKDKQQDEGAPVANINNSSDELKTTVLTHDEQELVARGENAKIILKVTDIGSSISEEEKKLIQDKLLAESKKEEKEADEKVASDIAILYIDLTLYKQVGSQEQTKVTETNDKINISIEIPEEFLNTDVTKSREFYVMRIHEGEITRIDGSYDAIKQIFTFETDRFSTYALTYQDTSRIKTYEGFRYLQLKVKSDKTSQTLSYKRKGTIDGYLIFGGKCGEEMVELADVPPKTTSYVIEDCIPRTFYKYQVKAYRVIDGEKIMVMTSKVVHSIVNGKTYADPIKVTLNMTSITLTKGDNKVLTGQVVLPKGKKLKTHTTVIRFESSNSEIASVNSKGKITGKAEGTCYIYAYAQNGVYKRIKVTVK